MSLPAWIRVTGHRRRWLGAGAPIGGAAARQTDPPTAAHAPPTPNVAVNAASSIKPALPGIGSTARYSDYDTGLCLDGNGAGNAYTNPCYGGGDTHQNWATSATEFGRLTLKDQQTGRCLDSNYAGDVYTSPCDGDDTYQNWSFGGNGPAYTIQNYQTGRCLDSNASEKLYTSPCNWNNFYENWDPRS